MAFGIPDEAELDRLIDKAKAALIEVVDHFFEKLHGETIPLVKKEVLGLKVSNQTTFEESGTVAPTALYSSAPEKGPAPEKGLQT
jgi:hypothetical protein